MPKEPGAGPRKQSPEEVAAVLRSMVAKTEKVSVNQARRKDVR